MNPGQIVKSYTFYLNSLRAQSKNGSDVNFALPANLVTGNASNQFVAYVNELSIPSYPIVVNAANNNNTITFKLQAYVISAYTYNNLLGKLEITKVNEWLDCVEIQRKWIDSFIDPIQNPWGAMFAASSIFPKAPTSAQAGAPNDDWTIVTATVPDGVYATTAALISAVNTAINTTITNLKSVLMYYSLPPGYLPGFDPAAFLNSPRVYSPAAGFVDPTVGCFDLQLSFAASGTKSTLTIQTNNNFGIQSNLGDQYSQQSYSGIFFDNYRVYFQESELLSMLGWPDQDFFVEAGGLVPVYVTRVLDGQIVPNYYDVRPSATYTSLRDMNLNPNVCTYCSIPSLTQQNSLISDPNQSTMAPSTVFSAIFNDPTIPRSVTYYSYPIKIQILDKVLNQFTIIMLDYRNRPIPYDYFNGPFFLEVIIEEQFNPGGQLPALNVQQLNDLEAGFFKQKSLELELQLESFIR